MPGEWEIGIIIFIFKKGGRQVLSNYRPITVINTICKIRTIALAKRITPITNYNTDIQCAHKKLRYTNDVIYFRKQKFVRNRNKGLILPDLGKAFGANK